MDLSVRILGEKVLQNVNVAQMRMIRWICVDIIKNKIEKY